MISNEISKQVLTIGCAWKRPKGGIGVVLNSYSRIYPVFNNIVNSNSVNKFANLLQLLYAFVAVVFKLLFNREITIVHIHTASNNSFRRSVWFSNIAKFLGRKVVMHIHGGGFKDYYEKNVTFVRHELEQCDMVVALTDSWGYFFREKVGLKRVTVIPNIIEKPICQSHKSEDGKVHLLFLGLITQQKGIYDLLQVLADNKEQLQDKIVLHIGGNGETAKLQQLIEEYSLSHFVKFEGWVSGEKKVELLNQSDVFLLPSYAEGLPIAILEAMSYRLPVIATPVGGIPEIVRNGENGCLVPAGEKDSLFRAIASLVENAEVRKRMGDGSANSILPNYPESVGKSLECVYNLVLT